MKLWTKSVVAASALSMATVAMAADPLANTKWQAYEDGQATAVIKISQTGSTFTGKIVSTNVSEGRQYVGRTVIRGLKADGNGKYSGGKITDPENGKTYTLTAQLSGSTLKLKGHLGPFHRTQTWKKK